MIRKRKNLNIWETVDFFFSPSTESFIRNFTTILELYKYLRLKLFWRPCSSEKLQIFSVILVFISGQVLQNTPSLLVKCDSQLTADVIPYNRNDGGPGAGLLSLVEVPEKAIVPFMVNAFDYVAFIHRLTWDLPGKFWKNREIINFHNYWFLIWPSYFNLGNN